jgi:phenylpyruvate tautomerase PptA (4-oxalocrotonate tautomerase family)
LPFRPDVVVFFRLHVTDPWQIVDYCKKEKIRIVFDTDDALDVVPKSNLTHTTARTHQRCYHDMVTAADIVTTTTPVLADHLRKLNPNVAVLPNSVDPEEWPSGALPPNEKVRIGWSGGTTHCNDLGLIADAVRLAQKKKPFTFVIQGLCREATPADCYADNVRTHGKHFIDLQYGKALKWLVGKLRGLDAEFYPSVPLDQHVDALRQLHLNVGVAPLLEGEFNQYKSCIKFYEYALNGAATLASRVQPYTEEVFRTVRNTTAAWTDALIEAASMDHTAVARQEREWVLANRNMETNVALWEKAYAA